MMKYRVGALVSAMIFDEIEADSECILVTSVMSKRAKSIKQKENM